MSCWGSHKPAYLFFRTLRGVFFCHIFKTENLYSVYTNKLTIVNEFTIWLDGTGAGEKSLPLILPIYLPYKYIPNKTLFAEKKNLYNRVIETASYSRETIENILKFQKRNPLKSLGGGKVDLVVRLTRFSEGLVFCVTRTWLA